MPVIQKAINQRSKADTRGTQIEITLKEIKSGFLDSCKYNYYHINKSKDI